MSVQPFKVQIPQATLDDLRQRLQGTRTCNEITGALWDYGANLAYMKEQIDYWQNQFDWIFHSPLLRRIAQSCAAKRRTKRSADGGSYLSKRHYPRAA